MYSRVNITMLLLHVIVFENIIKNGDLALIYDCNFRKLHNSFRNVEVPKD
jgi:hypothetical protein